MLVGIDIGKAGGIAIINGNFVAVHSMPVVNKEFDISEIARILRTAPSATVVIENVHSMPKQGVSSTFAFGRAKGLIEGIAGALGMKVVAVHIPSWKKHYPQFQGLDRKQAKAKARELAAAFYPSVKDKLTRVKDDGRADALLIARYYKEREGL